jgi:hypothetical protein
MTGTSAKLPVGTAFKAFLDEDLPLELAAAGPAPLVIGGPAAAPVVAVAAGPPKAVANTPSGFCYDVPKGYVGTGTADMPALTTATPACGSLGRK